MYITKKGDLQIFEYKQRCYECKKKDFCAGIEISCWGSPFNDQYSLCLDCLNLMIKELKKYKKKNDPRT